MARSKLFQRRNRAILHVERLEDRRLLSTANNALTPGVFAPAPANPDTPAVTAPSDASPAATSPDNSSYTDNQPPAGTASQNNPADTAPPPEQNATDPGQTSNDMPQPSAADGVSQADPAAFSSANQPISAEVMPDVNVLPGSLDGNDVNANDGHSSSGTGHASGQHGLRNTKFDAGEARRARQLLSLEMALAAQSGRDEEHEPGGSELHLSSDSGGWSVADGGDFPLAEPRMGFSWGHGGRMSVGSRSMIPLLLAAEDRNVCLDPIVITVAQNSRGDDTGLRDNDASLARADLLGKVSPEAAPSLDLAIDQLFRLIGDLGQQVGRSLSELGFAPLLATLAMAATAYEVTRQQKRGARPGLAWAASGAPATLTWFSGLPGSLSTEER